MAVVDCRVSIGLALGQRWNVGYQSRTGTGAVADCAISIRVVLGQ